MFTVPSKCVYPRIER